MAEDRSSRMSIAQGVPVELSEKQRRIAWLAAKDAAEASEIKPRDRLSNWVVWIISLLISAAAWAFAGFLFVRAIHG